MGQCFRHFDLEQRCEIAQRRQAGQSLREIAAALDCAPSSVARELKRNTSAHGYRPAYANQQAQARRWRGSKLLRNPSLQALVLERLRWGWAPQTVAVRLARDQGLHVSHETIYRFVYTQIARTNDYSWRRYLPRAKSKRGWRGRRGGSPADHIQRRVPISRRPARVANRHQPGHWEADLMLFSTYGQVVLALHERSSRLTTLVDHPGKAATSIADTLHRLLAPLPKRLRRTLTFDNGTEFAFHHRLADQLGIQTFFCDPHAPWQKGGIENAIGRLRRWLPRKTDLSTLPPNALTGLALVYNHTPRKCLGYRTPAEVFAKALHFKCESTFPPARE